MIEIEFDESSCNIGIKMQNMCMIIDPVPPRYGKRYRSNACEKVGAIFRNKQIITIKDIIINVIDYP